MSRLARRCQEAIQSANIFIGIEMYKRGLYFKNMIDDKLTKETNDEIIEYKSPGEAILEEEPEGDYITLEQVLDALPNNIIIEGEPSSVFVAGRVVNEGKIPKSHDIDLIFRQEPDPRIIEAIKRINPKWLANRIHAVFDPNGPLIGYSIPIFKYGFFKEKKENMIKGYGPYRRTYPLVERLSKEVKPFMKFRALKARSGWEKSEFFTYENFYNRWASKYLDRGIVIQKKADGRRFLIHKKGDKVEIITEDRMRDRSSELPNVVKELRSIKHDFIIDTEACGFDCKGKKTLTADSKEEFCEEVAREDCAWLTVGKVSPEQESSLVFHIHDLLYLDGKALNNIGYWDRFNKLKDIIPKKAYFFNIMKSSGICNTPREVREAVHKFRTMKGSEGIMSKVSDSKYPIVMKAQNRTGEWCLTGNNYILTENGFETIKDVQIGTKVFTKTGYLFPIIRKSSRLITRNEKLYDVIPKRGLKCRMTGNHEILTNPEGWIPAEAAKDLIPYYPKLKIPDEIPPDKIKLEWHGYKKEIKCTKDFWKLVGFWVAEGSLGNNNNKNYKRGEFELSQKNKNVLAKYSRIWERHLGTKPKIYHYGISHLVVWDLPFCRWLSKFFLDKNDNKTIPWFIGNLNDEKFNSFLNGYIEGDGWKDKYNHINFNTSDRGLAGRLYAILENKRIKIRIKYHKPRKGKGIFAFTLGAKEHGYKMNVKRVYTDYLDKVYDIEVENQGSFIVPKMVLSNSKIKNLKGLDVIVYNIVPKKRPTGEIIPGVWEYDCAFAIPKKEIPNWRESDIVIVKGKKYARIGRTFSTGVKCKVGDIVEVLVGRIRGYEKKGKKYYTWMFPKFREKRVEKHEPDSLDIVKKLAKVGPGEIKEKLYERTIVIKLKPCPYWKDKEICPLKLIFGKPRDEELAILKIQKLRFPIACPLANIYRCLYIKKYYYSFDIYKRGKL